MEFIIEQSSSLQNSASFTHSVINNLLELEEVLPKQSGSEVLKTLSSMKALVDRLGETASQGVKEFALNGILFEKQLEFIEQQIGQSYQNQKDLEQNIRDIEAVRLGSETKKEEIKQRLMSLEQSAEELKEQIDEARRVDAEKVLLSFVPIYGSYHIGKIIYNLIESETSLNEEINSIRNAIQGDTVEFEELNNTLVRLRERLDSDAKNLNELKDVQITLQEQRIACKKGVVLSSNAQLYWATMKQKLEQIEYRMEDVKDIVKYLDSQVKLTMDGDGPEEVLSLKDALIKFGEYADKIPSVSGQNASSQNKLSKGYIPTGSYQETSRNIKIVLLAECKKIDGTWQESSLDITNCIKGDITNVDGKLENTSSSSSEKAQTESYKDTSRNIKVILSAECKKIDGTWQEVSLDITNWTHGDIANIDGKL